MSVLNDGISRYAGSIVYGQPQFQAGIALGPTASLTTSNLGGSVLSASLDVPAFGPGDVYYGIFFADCVPGSYLVTCNCGYASSAGATYFSLDNGNTSIPSTYLNALPLQFTAMSTVPNSSAVIDYVTFTFVVSITATTGSVGIHAVSLGAVGDISDLTCLFTRIG